MVLVVVLCGLVGMVSAAGVPNTLNYQGTLTDSVGKPVEGTKSITFKLYSVAMGGTHFWTETQSVSIKSGAFSVVLGGSGQLSTEMFTGDTYIGVAVDSGLEMAPRQKFTSVAYALKAADAIGVVPRGGIIMWSGSVNQIPAGWALCDGRPRTLPDNSTITPPDLSGRFIVGVGGDDGIGGPYALNTRGGGAWHTLSLDQLPSHDHGGGNHKHGLDPESAMSGFSYGDGIYGFQVTPMNWHHAQIYISDSGNIITANGGNQPHENRPPYYVLAYIMRL